MTTIFFILLLGAAGFLVISVARSKSREKAEAQEDLDRVKATAEEDVTVFGEELSVLDGEAAMSDLDGAGRQDYQRALDSYETAKRTLLQVRRPDDIKNVTEALEDGRYAASCVQARVAGLPLPVRRPPCFFNPQHGPSVQDVDWAPVGGEVRPVPVCLADAERVECGAEPAVRKVAVGPGGARRAYWEAGDAYAPYNQGYFQSYAGSGMLPGVLMGAMLFGGFGGGWGGDYGSLGGDVGGDLGGGDMGGGDLGGGDLGGGDLGGGFGDFFG